MSAKISFPSKTPVFARGGMVLANHPLGAAAGIEALAAGGNAADAAVATLLTLSVVEPMMVGICGGGLVHLRDAQGQHEIIDGLSCAGAASEPAMYRPLSDVPPLQMQTVDRQNEFGASAVAVPGSLRAWALLHERHGRLPFADLFGAAIRHARQGFVVTPYLAGSIAEARHDLARTPDMAALFLPQGAPLRKGDRLLQPDYAATLEEIALQGPDALYHGALGRKLVDYLATGPVPQARLTLRDLAGYAPQVLAPVQGHYRGFDIFGPPPPASSGVHVTQMLNMLETRDLAAMGFDSPLRAQLLAHVMRAAFADRARHSGDPRFVDIPVGRLTSKDYARALMEGVPPVTAAQGYESRDTTHITIADGEGMIVTATFTINSLFGARVMVPGTGMILNNYMCNFDPNPGRALSVAPGKRVPTSMAPMIVARKGRPFLALGQPGGTRIFPSVLQAMVNIIDHGMALQEAVEAPRLWTQGAEIELEPRFAALAPALEAAGLAVKHVPHIGGGLNAIRFHADGQMEGAACWRADGTVLGLGGGLAEEGVRFWPDRSQGSSSPN
ncbi:gamma-glutamyltransferase [Thioclava litoralis]|uniref:Glutathione hydrolase proenzyme n=1 Tax=Thioclava litoralis TaxID=3076557 RepID=A0ABZ1DZ90_9RHOB|nr:gamma-glutamyltransferase [Thioclava sp. FTW29]